jgi:photosystem II stability/assembly factor-like uncharacterized protein
MPLTRRLRVLALALSISTLPLTALPLTTSAEAAAEKETARWSAETFAGLKLRSIGPALMSGRIAHIAIHPSDQSTWYVAVGSGGVWKTTNAGTTWKAIFEGQASYSIGTIALDPSNPNVVWVGTGENVSGRHVGYGDGIYRSRDGGGSWENLGLAKSEHIGSIAIDPRDSDVVFVAAQGPLWGGGGDRGVFKTTDGGVTWKKLLGGGEYTGANEIVMDPSNPDVLYAATHQRLRTVAALIDGGPETAIHKSTDSGATWRELSKGLPKEDKGKIGLAVSPHDTQIVYATIEAAEKQGGFFRSLDGGESWEKRNDYVSSATGPHYYQELFASPHAKGRVYQMDSRMHWTEDGGQNFRPVGEKNKHVDNHALAFDPNDPDYLLVGTDGGLYQSWDLGKTWQFVANLPVTQFYKVAVDNAEPFYNIYGGTQDNNTQGGPSRTDNVHGIRNSDWFVTLFGDGHQPAVDPSNDDIIYSHWQQGNLVRFDRKTGEMTYIQPQPGENEPWDRFNWDAPILISPHDPARLYHASQRVWRSDDRGDAWRAISGDLTRNLDRMKLPMMDRVWSFDALWDTYAMSKFSTITSLSESPLVEGLLYAGTDDGLIQVSEDGGALWREIDSLPGAGELFFVNDIKADLHDASTVYVAVDQHKTGDFTPYLLKSVDRGLTWKSIAGDLPARHLVWRLVQDHEEPGLLFAGTEFGVFFTVDGGDSWLKLSGESPTIPFRDLVIQKRENDLVGATFGRGFIVFDDYTPLRHVTPEKLEEDALLFPIRTARWYIERRTLGGSEKASQGTAFFTAPNPPFGAVFTYYLRDAIQTRQQARRKSEKEVEKKGGNTPWPGWEELRREELEQEPAIVLTIEDSGGNVVRRLTGPVEAGFHRVSWDLRYPSPEPWAPAAAQSDDEDEDDEDSGWLAAPGRYTVSLGRRLDGELTDMGLTEGFDVVATRTPALPGIPPAQMVEFQRQLAELQRAAGAAGRVIEGTQTTLTAISEVLLRSTASDTGLHQQAASLSQRLAQLQLQLSGRSQRAARNDPGPISIGRRLSVIEVGSGYSTYGPTATHRQSFEIAQRQLGRLREELTRLVDVDLATLEERLDAAGVPWTPGRGVPASGH